MTTYKLMPLPEIAHEIWDMKYRHKKVDGTVVDQTMDDTFRRVAIGLARSEAVPGEWASKFYDLLVSRRFIPAGRILLGAGTEMNVTMQNCYVLGTIPDSMDGIMSAVKEAALTLQMGGGIGMDFSTIRPKGAPVVRVNSDASGPLSFMDLWDAMCKSIMSAGTRRGAMMGTLHCTHPDVLDFIEAKRDPKRFRNFNLSVLVTDELVEAARNDHNWKLSFEGYPQCDKIVSARELWDKILRATYEVAEPGVIFIDRMNKMNNLAYCEEIRATNPCGEQPLPPYGACLLGSINLAAFVSEPFTDKASISTLELEHVTSLAVRMLDNVNDLTRYPLPQQRIESMNKRRLGLGITGLADALAMHRIVYGSEEAALMTEKWMEKITTAAYCASARLAKEKGPFLLFDQEQYLQSEFLNSLPRAKQIKNVIVECGGMRNSHLTSIAPTGTISLFAGNISSGIEPIFSLAYERKILQADGSRVKRVVRDFAVELWNHLTEGREPTPEFFVTAQDISVSQHVHMLGAAQKYVDSSVSKTVNCPEDMSFEDFKGVYDLAYDMNLRACATYRPNEVTGSILTDVSSQQKPGADGSNSDTQSATSGEQTTVSEPRSRLVDDLPMPRDEVLGGETYKLKIPASDHAIYITINDVVENGKRRPFEVFINSKNMEHYSWTVALTRMVSAIFRRGGDVRFVVEELKAVFDPNGGFYFRKRFCPSLLAAIGTLIEDHMIHIGYMEERIVEAKTLDDVPAGTKLKQCPKCGEAAVIRAEGCEKCQACDYSKC